MWVNILPDGAAPWGSFQQSDFHNQSPSCQNWSSNPPHKLHNFLCVCNLIRTGFIIHKHLSKTWWNYIFRSYEENVLECCGWMQGHWLLVWFWMVGSRLAWSEETNPSDIHLLENIFSWIFFHCGLFFSFVLSYGSRKSLTVSMSNRLDLTNVADTFTVIQWIFVGEIQSFQ